MKKLIFVMLCLMCHSAISQEEKKEYPNKKMFFGEQTDYLFRDGGTWVTSNPNYDPDEQYSAKEFRYFIKKGVHSEQIKIEIESDISGIGWYLSWDGYFLWNPQLNQIEYHSLSGSGAKAKGTVYVPDEKTIVNVFKVVSYEGEVGWHKDVFTLLNENELASKAYKLNEIGNWEATEELTWKRVAE